MSSLDIQASKALLIDIEYFTGTVIGATVNTLLSLKTIRLLTVYTG